MDYQYVCQAWWFLLSSCYLQEDIDDDHSKITYEYTMKDPFFHLQNKFRGNLIIRDLVYLLQETDFLV